MLNIQDVPKVALLSSESLAVLSIKEAL